MNNDRLQEQIKFLIEIDKVKSILRQSVILGDIDHRENDAEHSWHMAMCAMTLGEYFELGNVDIGKVLKMIMIHDIVEIYAGDVPAYSTCSQKEKHDKEASSMEKILTLLPNDQHKYYYDLWMEFENMETNESKYANTFDRFQGFIQNITSDGHTWKKFNPTLTMIKRRMEPIALYAPRLYEEVVLKTVMEYVGRGIIRNE